MTFKTVLFTAALACGLATTTASYAQTVQRGACVLRLTFAEGVSQLTASQSTQVSRFAAGAGPAGVRITGFIGTGGQGIAQARVSATAAAARASGTPERIVQRVSTGGQSGLVSVERNECVLADLGPGYSAAGLLGLGLLAGLAASSASVSTSGTTGSN